MRKIHAHLLGSCFILTSFFLSCAKSPGSDDDDVLGNWSRSSDFESWLIIFVEAHSNFLN
jgi:hypothetical protein